MKRNILHTLWAAALLLTGCTQEELPLPGADNAAPLAITITDGGYALTTSADGSQKAATRATEDGYRTEFTASDACGLYLVRNGAIVYDNVKLTATAGTNGSLTWQPEAGVTLAGGMAGEKYFLYYPYQETAKMAGKVNATDTTSDGDFFATLINDWQPEADQSDYTQGYTASDLMTATGIGQQKCHGYAVALQDATNGYCQWGVYGTELGCCPTDGSGKKQNNYSAPDIDWSGYAWTQKIITAAGGKDKLNATEDSGYPATYYAVVDYAHKVPSPANSTGWFLPSIGQMWNVYQNRASLFEGKTVVSGLKSDWYWSSSEFYDYPARRALYVSVRNGDVFRSYKYSRSSFVRPVLAF